MNLNIENLNVRSNFLIYFRNKVIVTGLYDHSKTKVRAAACKYGNYSAQYDYRTYSTKKEDYSQYYMKLDLKNTRDSFYYALVVNNEVGKNYIITTVDQTYDDFYDFFMRNYDLPLLKEWIPEILKYGIDNRIIESEYSCVRADDRNQTIKLHEKEIYLKDLRCYYCEEFTNESLTRAVSELLKAGKIKITNEYVKPLDFSSFDEYINRYGKTLVENLENEIEPLVPLKGQVDSLALKHKRLYPQQAACVNGIIALKEKGIKHCILNEGMGTGKVRRLGVNM